MNLIHHLRSHPLLSKAADGSLLKLSAASHIRVLDSADILVRSGALHKEVFLIAEGKIQLYQRNRDAKTQILVGLLKAPAIFGDAELYARVPWMVSAQAVEPTTLVVIPCLSFDHLVESDPAVAAALYRDACARHMLVIQIMQILALQKTQNQILRLLWGLSETNDQGLRIAPCSQTQLAKALGINRKTVDRNISHLEDLGLIRKEQGMAVLLVSDEYPIWRDLSDHGLGASWRLPDT